MQTIEDLAGAALAALIGICLAAALTSWWAA